MSRKDRETIDEDLYLIHYNLEDPNRRDVKVKGKYKRKRDRKRRTRQPEIIEPEIDTSLKLIGHMTYKL